MRCRKIEMRTGYLAMIGNIATLLGLLGTIVGLIKSFAGVSLGNTNDPATIEKATAVRPPGARVRATQDGRAIVARASSRTRRRSWPRGSARR